MMREGRLYWRRTIIGFIGIFFIYTWLVDHSPTETKLLDKDDFRPIRMASVSGVQSTAPWLSSPDLPRVLSRSEHDLIIELLRELTALLAGAGITYCNVFGTLIGSYMYHDLIPWDDDADMWVKYDDLPKVKRLFANTTLRSIYGLHAWKNVWIGASEFELETLQSFPSNATDDMYYNLSPTNQGYDVETLWHRFKFFRLDSHHAGNHDWHWPFVDIMFYRENKTHVWNHEPKSAHRVCLPKASFYPLILRPLGHMWLEAPRDTALFLRTRYGSFRCASQNYRHRLESRRWFWDIPSVSCDSIVPYYPRVFPGEKQELDTLETLEFNNTIIQTVHIVGAMESIPSKRPMDF